MKKEKVSPVISVRLSEREREELDRLVELTGAPVSYVVKEALTALLAQLEKERERYEDFEDGRKL